MPIEELEWAARLGIEPGGGLGSAARGTGARLSERRGSGYRQPATTPKCGKAGTRAKMSTGRCRTVYQLTLRSERRAAE